MINRFLSQCALGGDPGEVGHKKLVVAEAEVGVAEVDAAVEGAAGPGGRGVKSKPRRQKS